MGCGATSNFIFRLGSSSVSAEIVLSCLDQVTFRQNFSLCFGLTLEFSGSEWAAC